MEGWVVTYRDVYIINIIADSAKITPLDKKTE